jgi:hypothetical protein
MATVAGTMVDSAASSGWENCHMAGENMHIRNLLLNNFIRMVYFL